MARNPESSVEKITVEKNGGRKLVGLLHEAGSTGIIVLCHGFRSSKASRTIVTIADAVVKENFTVFRFDFSGNGESDGEFDYSNYWGEVDDLRAVVEHFTKGGRPISAILGHSKGANVALLYASKYDDIPAVVNVSARFNLERGMEERFGISFMETLIRDGYIDVKKKKNGPVDYRVTLQSVKDRLDINMEKSCAQIDKECRVLAVHGSKDEITPLADAFLFHKVVPNQITHIIDGANHCYTYHKDELTSAILSFLKDL